MQKVRIEIEEENREILRRYRGLLRVSQRSRSRADKLRIRKAFEIAMEAHKDMRRKSGEPYIYHPLAVAKICAEELGLDTLSIVCALLHDTVEDTDITLDDIQNLFGKKERTIIDGLTKISSVFDHTSSVQAESFRKMLLTLSDDVRVILIKLADRLHNMRTLEHMAREKQLKISSETLFMYAPLAHRLGLYNVKSELEDLALKAKEPETYEEIVSKLQKTQAVRTRFINAFTLPIRRALDKQGMKYEIKSRPKSVFSIWNKIHKKGVPFEEIYDLFAIRIILDTDPENEKADCWRVYSIVTDYYQPSPERLRDWISMPKASGYESLHTTVMSPTGKWVEVQIRSLRMDDLAERGYAAHWKYKDSPESPENKLDRWLSQVREVLENSSENAIEFIDNFKLSLFSEEIYVFTPDGELKSLPVGATALDFAFYIHSQIGYQCIGAKVNFKLVPLSHQLRSGDQVEILTSKKQRPKEDWLNIVVTASARQKIKNALKEEKKAIAEDGKEMLKRRFSHMKIDWLSANIDELVKHYNTDSSLELYYRIAKGNIDIKKLKGFQVENGRIFFERKEQPERISENTYVQSAPSKDETLLIGDEKQKVDFTLASCCNPIAGDEVFGFITVSDGIKIHRTNCPNAHELMSKYAYRVIKARWSSKEMVQFEVGLRFSGIDDVGLVQKITNIISTDMNVNMKAISFEANDGIFQGKVVVLVHDTEHLNSLMDRLKAIDGLLTVDRIESEFA
ncbi:MAG: bifunctional (p)ppGpp synthetase/guanosine-3',5'-bis(diphosphate) 3'-pyrophosphohydrolase [Crocinitomicaceae bacterium]|nr:bifunctional (p)ppGpp synthetase/guanosine-3',5'-bis(diphosphate) 3'-pyrophosphohydrolase [Crocinitomicaceae bacterium]